MKPEILIAALLPLAALSACRSEESPAPSEIREAPAPSTPNLPGYTLVFLKTGPKSGQLSAEENAKAFEGHFANMARMANEGQLVVAGPFGEQRHDPALRGIFVLTSARRDEAKSWAESDPTTKAGVFVLEFHDLETDAPLAAALARDKAWRAEQEAAGKTPPPGEGARGYVLLTAEHGDLAERELAGLRSEEGGVFLLGRLDKTRGFALLDAQKLDEARERFGPQLEPLGAHVLDEWFASNELAHMVD